jgi:hypothetical protein
MIDMVGVAKLAEQQAELLPAGTVMSIFSEVGVDNVGGIDPNPTFSCLAGPTMLAPSCPLSYVM